MKRNNSLLSLFTGAGGLDIGLEQAGFHTVLASEIEAHACESLRQNQVLGHLSPKEFDSWFEHQISQRCYKTVSKSYLGELRSRLSKAPSTKTYLEGAVILERDVRKVCSSEILNLTGMERGELALIAGGPPCQPFSRAGKRESVTNETGRLFMDFVRMVDELRPRWFLFENVKGLAQTKTPLAVLECNSCGANHLARFNDWERLHYKIADALDCYSCGSTSTKTTWRNKSGGSLELILQEFSSLGYTCHENLINAADLGAPQTRERLIVVGSRDNEPFTWPKVTHTKETTRDQEVLFKNEALRSWSNVREALWFDGHWKYGELGDEAVLWVKNVVRPHDEPVTWQLNRPSPTIGAHQGAKLAIAPSGVPSEQLARQQWHTLGRRQGDTPPVDVEHEYLTDLELLRLQTFPDSWYLYGTRMERAFQIGNAVPPLLGRAIGQSLLRAMGESVLPFDERS